MTRDVSLAKWSTMGVLFCNGVLYSTWGIFVPVAKARFHLSDTLLSLAMMSVALGGIATMSLAGRWIARIGSGRASVRSGTLMAVSAACILAFPWYPALLVVLVIYGIATAANDVAANVQGAHLEAVSGASVVGSLHGSFSVGGLVGSSLSGLASTSFPRELTTLVTFSVLAMVVMLVASRLLVNENEHDVELADHGDRTARERFTPAAQHRLVGLGAMAFLGLVLEGVVYDWSAVYMREVVQASPFVASLGYGLFAVGMAIGRISGDKIRDRFSLTPVIAVSGTICFAGLVLCLSIPVPEFVAPAFFITGIGLSNVIPIMFSSAGKVSRSDRVLPSRGLAITTRIAYTGLLAGPLIVGPLSDKFGLVRSLAVLSVTPILIVGGWLALTFRTGGVPWRLPVERSSQNTI